MRSCPQNWNTILNTTNMTTLEQLANEMEYHDVVLMDSASRDNSNLLHHIRKLEKNLGSKHKARAHEVETQEVEAEVNTIGQKPLLNPSNNFNKQIPPPANHVVLKGKPPIEAGGRLCRHCNSGKHWDYDCPHTDYQKKKKSSKFQKKPFKQRFKNFKRNFHKASTKLVQLEQDAWEAVTCFEEAELDDLPNLESASSSSSSEDSESSSSDDSEDF